MEDPLGAPAKERRAAAGAQDHLKPAGVKSQPRRSGRKRGHAAHGLVRCQISTRLFDELNEVRAQRCGRIDQRGGICDGRC